MLRLLLSGSLLGALAMLTLPLNAAAYTVQPGDSVWGISKRTGISVDRLIADNHLRDPDVIYAGEELSLATPTARDLAASTSPSPVDVQALLAAAAKDHGLRRSFVLAVSYWESGWNQQVVSRDGAIGLMQIIPATAAWAGPGLLGRRVDLRDAGDNAQLGAALLRSYLDEFGNPRLALAAYYQGAASARRYGILPSSRSYVEGIWALRNRFEASAQ